MRHTLPLVLSLLIGSQAQAFALQGPKWDIDRGPITYRIHVDGSDDVGDGSDLEAIREAFSAWSCIEGSGLRFVEGPPVDERTTAPPQNEVHVFFDETGQFVADDEQRSQTFIEPFVPGEPAVRDFGSIVLNGSDFVWGDGFTEEQSDIKSLVLIEIAIVLGLDQPCDENGENCENPDQTVLAGFIPANGYDAPGADDEAGMRSLYGVTDGSSCEGPFRVGEACTCNDDCVDGHVCAPGVDGATVCSTTCDGDDATCAIGSGCLMVLEEEGPRGYCIKGDADGLPEGTTCADDGDCSAGLCLPITELARTACRVSCDEDGECPSDYACTDGACIFAGNPDGVACETGCACEAQSADDVGAPLSIALFPLVLFLFRARNSGLGLRPGAGPQRLRRLRART